MPALSTNWSRSGPAIRYRVRADLRERRLQTASVVLIVAIATALVGLGLVVFSSVQAPFDQLFTSLSGAHLWVYTHDQSHLTPAQLAAITQAPNVVASTNLEQQADGFILLGGNKLSADLRSFPTQQPAIGKLLITEGNGLSAADPSGVIIDQAFASSNQLHIGDPLTLVTASGEQRVLVRGIAVDVNHDSQNDGEVCQIHLLRSTLDRFYPPSQLSGVIGLRLADPSATGLTFQTIAERLQARGYPNPRLNLDWFDWRTFRSDFGSSSRLSATLLLAFGIVSLLAAGVVVANLVIGQVVAQKRELGILKAVGFTPRQLVSTLVLEYLLLGVIGGALGLGLIALVAPLLLAKLVSSLGVPVPPQYSLEMGGLLLVAILLVITVCAAMPAWKAGRTRVVDAIRSGGGTLGRGRLAGRLLAGGLPVVAALGIRGVTARPLRALLVWLTLLLGVMAAVFALGATATIAKYEHDRTLTGVFADVYVAPELYDGRATQRLVASRPEIAYFYSSYQWGGATADGANMLGVIFTSGDTRRVAAALTSGRWYHASADEIVVGDQAMQQLGLKLGDQIPLNFTLDIGQTVTIRYTVVGTLFATQRADEAYAPVGSFTAHTPITADDLLAHTGYEITLRPGVSAQAFSNTLAHLTADRVGVRIYTFIPPPSVTDAVGIVNILAVALMVIAAIGILNAMLLSTRERYRELATLKAVGLTPGQVLRSVTDGALLLGALAVVVGIPLGLMLTAQGLQVLVDSLGGLPHFAAGVNWAALALLVPVTLLVSALGSYLPARWAARVPVSAALRYE